MNVDKCVALHNKIFMHGWLGSDKSIEDFERDCTTWFGYYSGEAEVLRDTLSLNLAAFLESAYVAQTDHCFFHYVAGLNYPSALFETAEFFNMAYSDGDPTRYVALYAMNRFASDPVGLVFDQRNNTAILCVDLDDIDAVCNGRIKWHPLERVLEAWLDMIEEGKAIVTLKSGDSGDPWQLVPYSEIILQETVDVFNLLVEEITTRLPTNNNHTPGATSPLISEAILDTANPTRGFAYRFAQKAKRPSFRYIAPGLEIPTASSVAEQPFASLRFDDSVHIATLPILLFRATDGASALTSPKWDEDAMNEPFDRVDKCPAGLYLSCTDPTINDAFEDECKLVLPYCIGAKGYARKSDGSRFGENSQHDDVTARDTFADVYQPGHQPFAEMHPCRLFSILENWLGMVRREDWKVGAEGVMDGIDEWKKADTEESWDKYVIPVTW